MPAFLSNVSELRFGDHTVRRHLDRPTGKYRWAILGVEPGMIFRDTLEDAVAELETRLGKKEFSRLCLGSELPA